MLLIVRSVNCAVIYSSAGCDVKTAGRPPVAAKPSASVLKRLEGTEIGRFSLARRISTSLETVLEKPKPTRKGRRLEFQIIFVMFVVSRFSHGISIALC